MNETVTPRLRTDVLLRPFEQFEGDNRFIVAVDDRHFVVSAAVAAVLVESRAHTTLGALAQRASKRLGMRVSAEFVTDVLSAQILSICFNATERRSAADCPIRFRRRVLGGDVLQRVLALAAPLFTRHAAIALITAIVAIELLVAARASNAHPTTLSGAQIVCAAALTMLGVFVHEIGHLAACVRFRAAHGGIGVGLYWCMPVLYAEVNGAWMLPRLQRAVVDVGGNYFQCVYVALLGATYLALGTPVLLEAIVWSHLLMLHTLNPVLKFDGYWLLTDLAGVSNLHAQIRDSARQTLFAIRGTAVPPPQHAGWPCAKALTLLCAFTGLAVIYFSFALIVLGNGIGRSAGEAFNRWASHDGAPLGLWHAVGESAVLALLVIVAFSFSFLLAHSITRVGKDSQA
jgi:putative peptide zinc metalloprotease protein